MTQQMAFTQEYRTVSSTLTVLEATSMIRQAVNDLATTDVCIRAQRTGEIVAFASAPCIDNGRWVGERETVLPSRQKGSLRWQDFAIDPVADGTDAPTAGQSLFVSFVGDNIETCATITHLVRCGEINQDLFLGFLARGVDRFGATTQIRVEPDGGVYAYDSAPIWDSETGEFVCPDGVRFGKVGKVNHAHVSTDLIEIGAW
jgi:hypothetical protein